MGRRRKLTRRQRALCWCLVLALAAGLGGLQYRYLSYWGPVRDAEDQGGIGKTAWLMDMPPEAWRRNGHRMLRGNEQALMAVTILPQEFPYGAAVYSRAYLDCTDARVLHAALVRLNIESQEGEPYWDLELFGRVEDPAGDRVRLELFWRPDTPTGLGWARNVGTVEIPKLDWMKKEDLVFFERQFSIPTPGGNGATTGELTARYTLLNWEEKELETWENVVEWDSSWQGYYF